MMYTMKKLINLLENISKIKFNFIQIIFSLIFFSSFQLFATEKWIIDKNASYIKFELPVLFANNVKGEFKEISGFVELNLDNKNNNKAIISVDISSIKINYEKYLDLLLSEIFFDLNKYPLGVIDTKSFKYENENELSLLVELTIKGISKEIAVPINVNELSRDFVQIKTEFNFSRNDYNIGIGQWSNTAILKDNITVSANIFLFKE